MDALLRQLQPGADGIAEYRDVEVSVDTLTLGSAPDRTIQLLGEHVGGEHADMIIERGGLQVTCNRGCKIRVGDTDVTSARLGVGDSFEVGGNRLTVLEPPGGFDVGLQIELDPDIDASVFERAFRTDLRQGRVSARSAAWGLSIAVVLFGFLVPFLLAMMTESDSAVRSMLPDVTGLAVIASRQRMRFVQRAAGPDRIAGQQAAHRGIALVHHRKQEGHQESQ